MPLAAAAILFGYTFLATVALAVVPHEPGIILAGREHGIWVTALVATAATLASAVVDYVAFVPLIRRVAHRPLLRGGVVGWVRGHFSRAPFLILAGSGLTPLPAWPFKAVAFAEHYPLVPYLTATVVGRFPRYVLLAWLGELVQIPTWVLVVAFVLLLLPSVRTAWKQRNAS